MAERGVMCVQCRTRPAVPAWHPFCSERCKLLDLGNWMDGRYRVPGRPESSLPDDEELADGKS